MRTDEFLAASSLHACCTLARCSPRPCKQDLLCVRAPGTAAPPIW